MEVNFNSREPVYVQVIRYFKQQIAKGQLKGGDVIPSRRELAAMLNINASTSQKAYKEMEEQGLIVTNKNFPSCITMDETILNQVKDDLIVEAVDVFVDSIKAMELPVNHLLEIIRVKYESEVEKGVEKG